MPRLKAELRDLVRTDQQIRRVLGRSDVAAGRQPHDLVCRPVRVAALSGAGERGYLVLSDGQIVAVLVRVECADEMRDGAGAVAVAGWFLEAGFGRCDVAAPPLFASLAEALAWMRQRLASGDNVGFGLSDVTRAGGQPDV